MEHNASRLTFLVGAVMLLGIALVYFKQSDLFETMKGLIYSIISGSRLTL